jgi:hypothetical protein
MTGPATNRLGAGSDDYLAAGVDGGSPGRYAGYSLLPSGDLPGEGLLDDRDELPALCRPDQSRGRPSGRPQPLHGRSGGQDSDRRGRRHRRRSHSAIDEAVYAVAFAPCDIASIVGAPYGASSTSTPGRGDPRWPPVCTGCRVGFRCCCPQRVGRGDHGPRSSTCGAISRTCTRWSGNPRTPRQILRNDRNRDGRRHLPLGAYVRVNDG